MSREIVKAKDASGKEIELAILMPGHKVQQEAQMAYNVKVASLIRQGAGGERLLLRSEVEKYMEEMGIWTHDDQVTFGRIQTQIHALELTLRKGGIPLNQGRAVALKMMDLRSELLELYAKRQQLDGATIEAVAENHRFNFLVSRCAVRADTGATFFADVQDYLDRAAEPIAVEAATTLAKMMYGFDDKIADNLFEKKWLKEYGLVNDEGRLTDRKGRLVDREGRLVNEHGRYIDEAGNLIDREGNRVDEAGNLIVETKPFLDDEGQPIAVASATQTEEPPKKRSRRKS